MPSSSISLRHAAIRKPPDPASASRLYELCRSQRRRQSMESAKKHLRLAAEYVFHRLRSRIFRQGARTRAGLAQNHKDYIQLCFHRIAGLCCALVVAQAGTFVLWPLAAMTNMLSGQLELTQQIPSAVPVSSPSISSLPVLCCRASGAQVPSGVSARIPSRFG